MSEKIKAIRGSEDRAEEVKQWLKDHGPTNLEDYTYDNTDRVYFIDGNNRVKCWNAKMYSYLFDIVVLPEKKPTLKVIKGNINRCKEVINTLINLGGVNDSNLTGGCDKNYYFINANDYIKCMSQDAPFFKKFELEIVELPKGFKPFDKVLVRDGDEDPWICDIFSHYDFNVARKYYCIGGPWHMAIPYEGNEDKVGKITD